MSGPLHLLRRGARGEALLLLHGLGGNAASWKPQLDGLGDRFRVLACDLPGWGTSPPPPTWTFAALGDALAAQLDAEGLEAVHLVGHSLGAMLAQEFALARPGRVRTLVLLAGSGRFGPPGGAWQREFVRARLAPLDAGLGMRAIAERALPSLFGGPVSDARRELARAALAAVPEATYRAALGLISGFDALDRLPSLDCPALLLGGDHDPMAPLAGMRRLRDALPDARFEVLEGAGHWLNLERPDEINRRIAAFCGDRHGDDRP